MQQDISLFVYGLSGVAGGQMAFNRGSLGFRRPLTPYRDQSAATG